ASPSAGYFRPLADQPTLAQALWTTVRELRMAGVTSDSFAAAFSEPEERVLSAASPTPCSDPRAVATGEGPPRVAGRPHLCADASACQAVRGGSAELTTVLSLSKDGHPREVLAADDPKAIELGALLESYERFLSDSNRGDMAAVYAEAVKHPDWCPIQPQDCWTELPDTVWAPLQRRLMDAMPGERIAPRALEITGAAIPRRLAESDSVRAAADSARNPLAFLMLPGNAQRDSRTPDRQTPAPATVSSNAPSSVSSPAPATVSSNAPSRVSAPHSEASVLRTLGEANPTIGLFHAGGREAEVEEIFRRILSRRVPLDQVEIVCASDAHVALVWEKALRHEWPVTLGPGIPAASTRPGRALIGFCDWIETDFSAGHLRHLLQSGDMGIEEDDEGFTAGQAARTIARAEAGWGRATYELSLGLLAKSYESRAADPDLADDEREAAQGKAELTAKIAGWITKLIAAVPQESAGKVALQDVVTVARGFLERTTARISQLDHRAASALIAHVDELRALGAFQCSLGEALHFVRERIGSLHVAAERPRPGHLYACRLQQAGYSGRPHLYVVGLEEGRVFPTATEDAILLDDERAAISPALKLSTDRIDEAVYAVLCRLANAGASSVTFSYSCRDTREFRETYASWLMLQAFRLQQRDATLSYPQMKAALREPVSSVPQDRELAATASAWWLRSVVSTGDTGVEAVEGSFAALARGRQADEKRWSSDFTEFDGHVPAAGASLDPCASGNAFSVTELEKAAACPYRFFLKRGLGLRPVDDGERDRDVWLDPLTRGSVLHDIYASLLRRSHADNRRPDVKTDGAWLTALAQGELDRLNREMPPATSEILERESRDFHADVELFLEGEAEACGAEPVGFEISFGRPLGGNRRSGGQETFDQNAQNSPDLLNSCESPPDLLNSCEDPLASPEPIEVDLGKGLIFRIAGRIDRIDKVGPSEFRILDYKTGVYWRPDWQGTFAGGRRLQHALYGLAAVALLRKKYRNAKVTGAEYYFSSRKGKRERVTIPAPTKAQTAAVLADLRELIVQGAFIHAADKAACKWCDYEAACTDDVHERAKQKLDDPKLVAFGRLAEHV
ncbi:MAG: PD-(D/E)XK nuclease family protein, partial [Acidobacteria bacterium]|nr:PD-(D/E)XK nuclease family protein [Acidobacteriota bacterium]